VKISNAMQSNMAATKTKTITTTATAKLQWHCHLGKAIK